MPRRRSARSLRVRTLPLLPLLLAAGPAVAQTAAAQTAAERMDEARALYGRGEVAAAVAAFRQAAEAAGDRAGGAVAEVEDPALAAGARNNACVLLTELGEHPAALEECRRALELRRLAGDRPGLARTLNNLGLVNQNLGRYAESERRFRQALAINRERGDAGSEAVNLANLGATATLAGRYAAALADHRAVVALAAAHPGEPWAAEQARLARLNQAVVLENLGAFRDALALYREVLAESDALAARERAALEVNTGVVYRNLGDPVTALSLFRSAEATYRRLDDLSGLAHAALDVALALHLNLERPSAAEAEYRRALALAEQAGDRPREIEVLFYLARLLFERGRLDQADDAFARALAAAEESGSAVGRWSAREGLGRVAEARGDLGAALDHLLAALDEIETVRTGLERGMLRAGFFGARRPAYAAAVRVLVGLDAAEPGAGWGLRALEVVQRAKARELLEALGPAGRPGAPLPAEALARLGGAGAVVEYFAGEEALYRWEIGPAGVHLSALGPRAPVEAAVRRVHRSLAAGQAPGEDDLAALGATLLGGLEALAGNGREPADPLRVAPDASLRYLPFELLPAAGAPLLERATVSYLPSASALGWLETRRRGDGPPPAWEVVGFGDPSLPAAAAESAASRLVSRYGLGPLPAAAAELELATAAVPGRHRLRLGADATEAGFRQAVAGGARVVHLAVHTVVDERPGRGAAILLAPGGEGEGGEAADPDADGLLRPEEVAALSCRADLTVLASCRTALDAGDGGRALSSLTGSFLAAGSGAVVATLWDVGDAATAALMEQFYHQLGRGRRPAAALALAKRRLAGDPRWADPWLWSGYVLIGEAPPPAPRRSLPVATWLLAAAVLTAVAILLALSRAVRHRRSRSAKDLRAAQGRKPPSFELDRRVHHLDRHHPDHARRPQPALLAVDLERADGTDRRRRAGRQVELDEAAGDPVERGLRGLEVEHDRARGREVGGERGAAVAAVEADHRRAGSDQRVVVEHQVAGADRELLERRDFQLGGLAGSDAVAVGEEQSRVVRRAHEQEPGLDLERHRVAVAVQQERLREPDVEVDHGAGRDVRRQPEEERRQRAVEGVDRGGGGGELEHQRVGGVPGDPHDALDVAVGAEDHVPDQVRGERSGGALAARGRDRAPDVRALRTLRDDLQHGGHRLAGGGDEVELSLADRPRGVGADHHRGGTAGGGDRVVDPQRQGIRLAGRGRGGGERRQQDEQGDGGERSWGSGHRGSPLSFVPRGWNRFGPGSDPEADPLGPGHGPTLGIEGFDPPLIPHRR